MDYIRAMADKKTAQICIRIEPDAYEKLKELAELEERSVGFLVRKMIGEGIEKRMGKKPFKEIKKTINGE